MGCGASKDGNDAGGRDMEAEDQVQEPGAMEVMAVEGAPEKRKNNRRVSVSAETVNLNELKLQKTRVIPKSEQDRDHIRACVANNFLFNELPSAQMNVILDAVDRKEYNKGDYVIKQGDPGDDFYILDTGTCHCFVDFKNGKDPVMVKVYNRGESFGELALLYMTPRAASIVAQTKCVLWAMDRLTFRKVLMTTTAAKREKYENFLEKVSILQTLDKYERSKVADCLKETKYSDGEYIITEGDNSDRSFFMLEYGTAIATKVLDGMGPDPIEVKRYSPGEYFGELALINNKPRAANVVAVGDDCVCVKLDSETFTRLFGPVVDILKRDVDQYKKFENQILHDRRQ